MDKTFEYTTEVLHNVDVGITYNKLNELGEQRWQLVATVPFNGVQTTFIFMREVDKIYDFGSNHKK